MRPLENLKSAALDLRFEGSDGVPLWVVVRGEIDFASAPSMQVRIMAGLEQRGTSALVMNLAGVDFMDSSGLRALVQIQRDLSEAGGSLVLFDPTAPVQRILTLTGLDRHLRVADTVPEAERIVTSNGREE